MTKLSKKQIARRKQPPPNLKKNSKYHNYKICTGCDKRKRFADFPIKNGKLRANNPKKYGSQCKECHKSVSASKVDPNFKPKRQKYYANERARRKEIRRETRIKVFHYLAETGCSGCGIRDPRVLEFDHLDPSKKKHSIANLVTTGYKWESPTLQRELAKCRVICSNCHRVHTVEQQDYYSDPEVAEVLRGILEANGIG